VSGSKVQGSEVQGFRLLAACFWLLAAGRRYICLIGLIDETVLLVLLV